MGDDANNPGAEFSAIHLELCAAIACGDWEQAREAAVERNRLLQAWWQTTAEVDRARLHEDLTLWLEHERRLLDRTRRSRERVADELRRMRASGRAARDYSEMADDRRGA